MLLFRIVGPSLLLRSHSTSVQCLLAGLIFPQLPSVPLSGGGGKKKKAQ